MGLKDHKNIFEEIRTTGAAGIWPKFTPDQRGVVGGPDELDFGPTNNFEFAYDDGSATLRQAVIKVEGCTAPIMKIYASRSEDGEITGAAAATEDADDDDDDDNAPDPDSMAFSMSRPSHVVDYLLRRYLKLFERTSTLVRLNLVFDYMGCTPRIKEILRAYRSTRKVDWPDTNRHLLFESNAPFRNTVEEIFADPEARRLYFKYITEQLLIRLPREKAFPKGAMLCIYGAVYKNTPGQCIMMAGTSSSTGLPYDPAPCDDAGCPKGEADIVIRWLLNVYRSSVSQLLISPDSDFMPILLHIVNNKYREDSTPNKHNIYWQHRSSYKRVVKKADFMKHMLPPGVLSVNPYDVATYSQLCRQWAEFCARYSIVTRNSSSSSAAGAKRAATGPPDEVKVNIRKRVHVMDMNSIYQAIWTKLYAVNKNCNQCDPIDVFNVLCAMSGGDYLKPLAYINFKMLWETYTGTDNLHQRLGDCLCCRRANTCGKLSISTQAVERLIVLAYKRYRRVPQKDLATCDELKPLREYLIRLDGDKTKAAQFKQQEAVGAAPNASQEIEPGMAFIPMRSGGLKREHSYDTSISNSTTPTVGRTLPSRIPPEDLTDLTARVFWVVNYYTRSHGNDEGVWVLDPLEETSPGVSKYGYCLNRQVDRCAFATNCTLRRSHLYE